MDLTSVTGLDATSVSTCFRPLCSLAMERETVLVIVAKEGEIVDLLRRQGVLTAEAAPDAGDTNPISVTWMETFERACEWCEDRLIANQSAQTAMLRNFEPTRQVSGNLESAVA